MTRGSGARARHGGHLWRMVGAALLVTLITLTAARETAAKEGEQRIVERPVPTT